ncbi:hypothetical protein [Phormidium sp. CCY1219]|uniref:hypothetical protein n=1 Tax=Phormidium sp. CCY1219 TaxID=2886104 RepID=UPI002D1EB8CB|nr:hypothetical protein [Phormidium sp. CCY1219]MEB3828496.1 hypothetical protein [Phormidium sp. CCY1219]
MQETRPSSWRLDPNAADVPIRRGDRRETPEKREPNRQRLTMEFTIVVSREP